ncbi:hypothetical protein [Thalassotalea aquiviva]|uniref:hypothetical protein n=1 Tax=Thalassotalea aquiviva TaxID=3242415 RepID=UPI00352B2B35
MQRVNQTVNDWRLGFVILATVFLWSCSNKVKVEASFPDPVINQIPLVLGVIYEPEFKQYHYIEADEERSDWEINMGEAQVKLFDTVLNKMFAQVNTLEQLQPGIKSVDIYFQPTVEEFQYNVPQETQVDMFEVWIKYHLKVYDSDGKLIADWIQTAYGKTPAQTFTGDDTALNEAMVIALRDIGASFVLRFAHIPEIKNWLAEHQKI